MSSSSSSSLSLEELRVNRDELANRYAKLIKIRKSERTPKQQKTIDKLAAQHKAIGDQIKEVKAAADKKAAKAAKKSTSSTKKKVILEEESVSEPEDEEDEEVLVVTTNDQQDDGDDDGDEREAQIVYDDEPSKKDTRKSVVSSNKSVLSTKLSRGRVHKSKITAEAVANRFRKGLFLNVNQPNKGDKAHAETLASASAFNESVLFLKPQNRQYYYIPLLLSGTLANIHTYIKSHGKKINQTTIMEKSVTSEELCSIGFLCQGTYDKNLRQVKETGEGSVYPEFDYKSTNKALDTKFAVFFQVCTNFTGSNALLKEEQLKRMDYMDSNDPKLLNYFWTKRKYSKGVVDDEGKKKFLMKVMSKIVAVKTNNTNAINQDSADSIKTINVSAYQGLHKGSSGVVVAPLAVANSLVAGYNTEGVTKPYTVTFYVDDSPVLENACFTSNNKLSLSLFCDDIIEVINAHGINYFGDSLLGKMRESGMITGKTKTSIKDIVDAITKIKVGEKARSLWGRLVTKTKEPKDQTIGSGIIDPPKKNITVPVSATPTDTEDENNPDVVFTDSVEGDDDDDQPPIVEGDDDDSQLNGDGNSPSTADSKDDDPFSKDDSDGSADSSSQLNSQ
jgi:hypothetical protein